MRSYFLRPALCLHAHRPAAGISPTREAAGLSYTCHAAAPAEYGDHSLSLESAVIIRICAAVALRMGTSVRQVKGILRKSHGTRFTCWSVSFKSFSSIAFVRFGNANRQIASSMESAVSVLGTERVTSLRPNSSGALVIV